MHEWHNKYKIRSLSIDIIDKGVITRLLLDTLFGNYTFSAGWVVGDRAICRVVFMLQNYIRFIQLYFFQSLPFKAGVLFQFHFSITKMLNNYILITNTNIFDIARFYLLFTLYMERTQNICSRQWLLDRFIWSMSHLFTVEAYNDSRR